MQSLKKYSDAYYSRATYDKYPRLRAWEFLWDHIQSIPTWNAVANDKNLEKSALHIGFYLANWGMFRGSSELLNVNIKFFEDLTSLLFKEIDGEFWNLTLYDFTEDNKLAQCALDDALDKIRGFECQRISWTDTLVTKLLLGVWGQCPARDTNFNAGFGHFLQARPYARTPRTSGRYLVYLNQIKVTEGWTMPRYRTTGDNEYPPGKIIDMAFFEYGERHRINNRLRQKQVHTTSKSSLMIPECLAP